MNRLWQKIKKFFSPRQEEKAKGDVKFSMTSKPKDEKKISRREERMLHRVRRTKRTKRKYRRYLAGKHPLHHAHCGTFSPVPKFR